MSRCRWLPKGSGHTPAPGLHLSLLPACSAGLVGWARREPAPPQSQRVVGLVTLPDGTPAPAAENSRTREWQGGKGPEAQGGEGVSFNQSRVGQEGCKGGDHSDPVTADVLFPAPEMPAAQDAQPLGLGGDGPGLASPEPQHQSRL